MTGGRPLCICEGTPSCDIGQEHEKPHVAVITAAQLAAAAPVVLDISNTLHSHTVSLTGAQVGCPDRERLSASDPAPRCYVTMSE